MDVISSFKKSNLIQVIAIGVIVYFMFTYMKKETLENDKEVEEPSVEESPVETPSIDVQPKDQLAAEDLLPKYDESNEFAKENPVSNLLKEQNFLIGGYHTGVTTHVSSQKIPYHDLRSVPAIPKDTSLSVWNISSYDEPAGAGRRQLEIS